MPSPFIKGPPLELIISELVLALIVFTLCFLIYKKTTGMYQLTKHRGIYYFRNIFLFFGLAYLFRLVFVTFLLISEVGDFGFHPWKFLIIPIVSLFSTLAIFSMVAAIFSKQLRCCSWLPSVLVAVAALISLLTLLTKEFKELLCIQTLIFLIAVIYAVISHRTHKFSQNTLTYVLLFVFWVLNVVAFNRAMVPYEYKAPLYVLSVGVFCWVYYRVSKRLVHAKT